MAQPWDVLLEPLDLSEFGFSPGQPRDGNGRWRRGGGKSAPTDPTASPGGGMNGGGTGSSGNSHSITSSDGQTRIVEYTPKSRRATTTAADGKPCYAYHDQGTDPAAAVAASAALAATYDRSGHPYDSPPTALVHSQATMDRQFQRGALGCVESSMPTEIHLSEVAVTRKDKPADRFMESYDQANPAEYFVAHEYGHSVDFSLGNAPAFPKGPVPKGGDHKLNRRVLFERGAVNSQLSSYGQTNQLEAFAEAFADFNLTNGAPTNPATQAYARMFKWGKGA